MIPQLQIGCPFCSTSFCNGNCSGPFPWLFMSCSILFSDTTFALESESESEYDSDSEYDYDSDNCSYISDSEYDSDTGDFRFQVFSSYKHYLCDYGTRYKGCDCGCRYKP